jgi:hypothetical protein
MRPYDQPIVTFRVMLRGYQEAFERFQGTGSVMDAVLSAIALFEALNWAVAFDDRCGAHWVPDGKPLGPKWLERWTGDATIARAIRFARNRVHHQWAEALIIRLLSGVEANGLDVSRHTTSSFARAPSVNAVLARGLPVFTPNRLDAT